MMLKLLLSITIATSSLFSVAQTKKITVVIDAGHGGSDPGHLSKNKNHQPEKELNLAISNLVGEYIEKYLTNVELFYTRTDDRFVSLDDRVFKANSIKADYFISIHCNANDRNLVHGTESHVHALTSKKSVDMARIMEKEFSTRAGRHSRGVKDSEDREHSLQVLKYTNMTSVLLECGFLTNDREANYLNTLEGQEILASAIFRGFRTFIQSEHPSVDFVRKTPLPSNTGKYAIQIMSSKDPIDPNTPAFKKVGEPVVRQEVASTSAYKYRYIVGTFDSKEAGKATLSKVQSSGFKDAMLIQIQ